MPHYGISSANSRFAVIWLLRYKNSATPLYVAFCMHKCKKVGKYSFVYVLFVIFATDLQK